jgi:hypothetical protein
MLVGGRICINGLITSLLLEWTMEGNKRTSPNVGPCCAGGDRKPVRPEVWVEKEMFTLRKAAWFVHSFKCDLGGKA